MTTPRDELIEIIHKEFEGYGTDETIADAILERWQLERRRCCREMNDEGLCIIHSNFGKEQEEE